MKKLFLLLVSVAFIATASYAQTAPAPAAPAKSAKTSAKYVCPKCHAVSDKAGTCGHCKVAMVKEGTYYCPGCYATSDKPGTCAKCKKTMVVMAAPASTPAKN